MKNLTKLFTISFVITFACFQILLPVPATANDRISRTSPQMLATPEEDISAYDSTPGGKSSKVAIWIGAILGVALIAALAGGGGGGGGGGGSDGGDTGTTSSDTGDITVDW